MDYGVLDAWNEDVKITRKRESKVFKDNKEDQSNSHGVVTVTKDVKYEISMIDYIT